MKGILEFDLNDPDEIKKHLRCILSTEMAIVLWEIQHNLIRKLKIEDKDEYNDGVLETIEAIGDLMEEGGININELID